MSRSRSAAGGRGAAIVVGALLAAMLAIGVYSAVTAHTQRLFDEDTAALITPVSGDVTELPETQTIQYVPLPCNHDSSPTDPGTGHATRAWNLPGGVTIAITARSFPDEQATYANTQELAASVAACTAYERDGTMHAIRNATGTTQALIGWDAKQAHDQAHANNDGHDHDEGNVMMTWTTTPDGRQGTVWASTTDGTTVYVVGVAGTSHIPDPGTATSILVSQLSGPAQ